MVGFCTLGAPGCDDIDDLGVDDIDDLADDDADDGSDIEDLADATSCSFQNWSHSGSGADAGGPWGCSPGPADAEGGISWLGRRL